MTELSEVEKQIAVMVIREMEKQNRRSLHELQAGTDAVLRVFREVTAPPRPLSFPRRLLSLLLPFGRH